MTEIDGIIKVIDVPGFTEGPWVFKRDNVYYLTYSANFPEVIDYAIASKPEGPWVYHGRLSDEIENSTTNHQGVVNYKGRWYYVYHSAGLPTGGRYRRSVCIDYLFFNEDGSLQKVNPSLAGVFKFELIIDAWKIN